jgi:hypothetical protein
MTSRWLVLGCLLLVAPAVARADDGGAADAGWYFPPTGLAPEPTVTPAGVALGRATPFLPSFRPMYVDSHQHAVGAGGFGGSGDEATCIDLTSATLTGTVLIDLPSHVDVRSEHIAVAPGSDTFISLWVPNVTTPYRVYVYRGACGGVGEQLGTVNFPLWQRQPLSADGAPLPMWSDGTVVLPGTTGLLALPTAPLADPTEFLTHAALEAALLPPEPIPGLSATEPRDGAWRVDVMTMLPGDHLWAVLSRSFFSEAFTGYSVKYLVEISRTGQLTVIRGPDYGVQGVVSLTYDAALDSVLLAAPTYPGTLGRQLGLISVHDPAGRLLPVVPGPLYLDVPEAALPDDGFFGTADGRVFGRTGGALREFGIDPDRADFDGDGLSASVEAMLGTSDLFWDTDGDGVEDGLERFQHSDPTDAGSPAPPAPLEPAIFAPSLMPQTWSIGGFAPDTGVGVGHGLLCRGVHAVGPDSLFACVDEDGKWLAPAATPDKPYVFPLQPSFSPDGTAAFYDRREIDGTQVSHLRLDPRTGVEALFGPNPHVNRGGSTVLSRDVVLSNPTQGVRGGPHDRDRRVRGHLPRPQAVPHPGHGDRPVRPRLDPAGRLPAGAVAGGAVAGRGALLAAVAVWRLGAARDRGPRGPRGQPSSPGHRRQADSAAGDPHGRQHAGHGRPVGRGGSRRRQPQVGARAPAAHRAHQQRAERVVQGRLHLHPSGGVAHRAGADGPGWLCLQR